MKALNTIEQILIIAFLSLLAYPLLHIARALDANTLVSWSWVFHATSTAGLFFPVLAAVAFAVPFAYLSIPERGYPAVLLVLPLIAIFPLWGIPEMILDAGRYFIQAKYLAVNGVVPFLGEWGKDVPAWTDMPLVPLLNGLVFLAAGEGRMPVQALNTLLFAITAFATSRIGEHLWDRKTGFHAGLLLLAIPYLLVQIPLFMADVPAMCFLTIALLAYLRAVTRGGGLNLLAASVALLLALLTKYSVLPMLFLFPLASCAVMNGSRNTVLKRSAVVLLTMAGVAAVLGALASDVVLAQAHLLRSYQVPALRNWGEGFLSTFLFQSHPFMPVLAGIGIIAAIRKRDRRLLLPAGFIIFVLGLRADRIRYLLPLLPLFSLMASAGLRSFAREETKRFIVAVMVIPTLVIVYGWYRPFLGGTSMANLQDAGEYLNATGSQRVSVIVLPQEKSYGNTEIAVPLLDLYGDAQFIYRRDPALRPSPEALGTSPLRFTWEFDISRFYNNDSSAGPFALISGAPLDDAALAPIVSGIDNGYRLARRFERASGAFRYRTFVYIFRD